MFKEKIKAEIKEKHLIIPESIPDKPYQHSIYLYHEEINVLETFQFPIKKSYQVPIKSEAEEKSEPDLKPETETKAKIEPKPESELKPTENKTPEIITSITTAKPIEKMDETQQNFINIASSDLPRVLLVSNIYKKEPVNKLSYYVKGSKDAAEKIYLFTQIDNRIKQTIEHQWWYKGKIRHKRKFTILGKRWRCYSSKNIGKLQQGEWQVKVVDEDKKQLASVNFNYQVE